ncbi:cytochrome c3 family protein [Neorhodopirellula lusitana]|uniref:cytochrome c3 family protein n=1 Tax=Neorhodopirellula lusitana TaxID=445327 RepID=UPI00384D8855
MSKSEIRSDANDECGLDRKTVSSTRQLKIRIAIGVVAVALFLKFVAASSLQFGSDPIELKALPNQADTPRYYKFGQLVTWWGKIPDEHQADVIAINSAGEESNIHPEDYAGAESCRECHTPQYQSWSSHPHRFMNAYAKESTVMGDFSGEATISYLRGLGEFYMEGSEYRMRLTRNNKKRVYAINQTIGSRFTQYYIGKMIQGPEPTDHQFYKTDHLLPFGYWMDERKWVPIVHVHGIWKEDQQSFVDEDALPSSQRLDPFSKPGFVPYSHCNDCHTTFPLADIMVKSPHIAGRHLPEVAHFSIYEYLKEQRPEFWTSDEEPTQISTEEFEAIRLATNQWEAPDLAINLGISCEACHLGSKAHVEQKSTKPVFFPKSPHFHIEGTVEKDFGRTQTNVNYICGRCHVGDRPLLAGGMSTWNSTEYTDATRGGCYSELRCIDCHDPHTAIGQKWKLTPAQDDQSCIRCHDQFIDPTAAQAHTHHKPDTAGSRCMNCHMPRMNEGLQDLVRTHMIFSPTNEAMIEENQPNACNMCHTEQSIDWTLTYLQTWYGKTYSDEKVSTNYPDRDGPVAVNWLASGNSSVRLIAADSLIRTQSTWAINDLLNALDDPYLINRQFAGRSLEQMLDIKLTDYGYQFYMTGDERRDPLGKLREEVKARKSVKLTSASPSESDADSQ